jgi:DNA-binding response OmpR family regulator
MIVDDDVDITEALEAGLKLDGVNVGVYNDPVKAVEDFKIKPYDLVITDIRMPKMTGFELYRELKKTREEVPVWFMTAFVITANEIAIMFPDMKIGKLLVKPIPLGGLKEMILDEKEHNGHGRKEMEGMSGTRGSV